MVKHSDNWCSIHKCTFKYTCPQCEADLARYMSRP